MPPLLRFSPDQRLEEAVKMSIEAMAVVLYHSESSGTDKLVLLGIASHEGDGGAWPAIATLARYANVKERAVQYSVRRLVAAGEIEVLNNLGGFAEMRADRRPNRYRVLVSCPPDCDGTTNHRRGVQPTAPREPLRGATQRVDGVQPTAPEPSLEPSIQGNELFTPTGVPRENGATNPEIGRLVAGYVDDYKSERANKLPPTEWRGAAGKAAARALKNGERPADIAEALGIIAHEGKQPSSLPHVLADYHANRPRRSYQR